MTVNLKVPNMNELKPRITVFGVGGAGGNAVNNMIQSGLDGVDFVVANTDAQALMMSSAERRIQMGARLTEGLGAGSQPEIGRSAAEEARDEIQSQIEGAHMIFITAGMGGGTGTGAAPVIAAVAREQGILTVGVVTKPFQFEGQRRLRTAEAGIIEMQKYVDTLIVIPNQNLFRVANENTTFADAFAMADQVLYSGVACITSVIVKEGLINLDFADVRAVMSEMGKAMMGTGEASGEKRAIEAAEAAISNPLLDNVSMIGARGLLISISGGKDLTLYEVDEAATRIREEVDPEANIILGATFDDALEGNMRVSVVATGIDAAEIKQDNDMIQDNIATMTASKALGSGLREGSVPAGQVLPYQKVKGRGDSEWAETGMRKIVEDRAALRPVHVDSTSNIVLSSQQLSEPVVDEKHFIPPIAERVSFMPQLEDFPLPAQNKIKAQSGQEVKMGINAYRKKTGFFQRLANLGLMGRGEQSAHDVRTVHSNFDANSGCPDASSRISTQRVAELGAKRQEEDNLEIPAFLRRQAN